MSLPTNYKGALYTANELNQMREWLKELYKDMNPLMIDLVSNKTILESIERNYPCGLTAFVKQCKPGNE